MIHRNNPTYYILICLAVTLMAMVVACSSEIPVEVTGVSQVIVETETRTLVTQEVKATSTGIAVTPTITLTFTPTVTLTPLPTNTATSSPTISPLRKVAELPVNSSQFGTNLAITLDGTLLAVSNSSENAVHVFDMVNQTVKWRIVEDDSGGTDGYSSLAFSPNGRYLAAWDNGFVLFVWDMDDGQVVYQIRYNRDWEVNVRSVSFSPDSQLLALSSFRLVDVYSMVTGELVDGFPSPNIVTYPPTDGDDYFLKPGHHSAGFLEVGFVPNHTGLLAIAIFPDPFVEGGGVSGGVYFWDMEAQSLENVIPGEGGFSIIVSPDGHLLMARIDKQLVGWDIVNNSEIFVVETTGSDEYLIPITDAGFFATLGSTSGLKIWDFNGELVAMFPSDKLISDAIFTPDGRLLIAYSDENSPIEMWEIHE